MTNTLLESPLSHLCTSASASWHCQMPGGTQRTLVLITGFRPIPCTKYFLRHDFCRAAGRGNTMVRETVAAHAQRGWGLAADADEPVQASWPQGQNRRFEAELRRLHRLLRLEEAAMEADICKCARPWANGFWKRSSQSPLPASNRTPAGGTSMLVCMQHTLLLRCRSTEHV